jgi:hypothetical protein
MFKAIVTTLSLAAGLAVAAVPALAGGQQFGSASGGIQLSGGQQTSFSVKDGNPVGTEGRPSADTAGDRGRVEYHDGTVHFTADVLCAAYINPRGYDGDGRHSGYKMRFAYQKPDGSYTVVRVVDRGSPGREGDTYASGQASSFTDAVNWCNRGAMGSGHPFSAWTFYRIIAGNIVVH